MTKTLRLVVLAGVALTGVGLTGCAGSDPAAVATPRSSGPAPLTVTNAYAQQSVQRAKLTGLTGTIAFTQKEAGGTLTLSGTFTTNLADPANPTSRLVLRRTVPAPVTTAEVRGIGRDVYFKAGAERWVHIGKANPPANTTVAGEQALAALLLGGISPAQFSNLLKVNPLTAGPVSGSGAAARYQFGGAAKLEYTDDVSTNFKDDVITALKNQGVLTDDFALVLDGQARPVRLRQQFRAGTVDIDYLVSVTGYSAAPTPIPTA